MGRHSSGRSGPFIRSLIGWLLPWALIATVVAVGAWIVVDYRGRDASPAVATSGDTPVEQVPSEPDPEPDAEASPTDPVATPTAEDEPPRAERGKDGRRRDRSVRLITEGVSVQVLNGTADEAAGEAMAERLAGLGYQVVTVESTSAPYKETTVFWSFPDATKAAEALAARFGWLSDRKPGNLADTVSLHVVVGRDFDV